MRCISTLSAIFQTSCDCANITWSSYQITWRHMTFFKKCKYRAFKTHQRCTIITCDTSPILRHIRCEIHSVFIGEVWYAQEITWDLTHTHKHKYMHKVGTIAVFWTSSPTKFTRDNLRYSILKTVSSKVRWIASQVPLRQSQIKFNWGVSQVSPLKTIKSKAHGKQSPVKVIEYQLR